MKRDVIVFEQTSIRPREYSREPVEKGVWMPLLESAAEEEVNGFRFTLRPIATSGSSKWFEAKKVRPSKKSSFLTAAYQEKLDEMFPNDFDYLIKYTCECDRPFSEAAN